MSKQPLQRKSRSLNETIALVTGAGRGIGKATAHLLASRGARVAMMSRTSAELEGAAHEIAEKYGKDRVLVLSADVSDENALAHSFARIEGHWGPLNCLVNNAGVFFRGRLEETSLDDWNRVFAVNVTGAFLCAKYAIAQMRKTGGGSIVNVSSLSGIHGPQKFPGFGAYISSKHALVGLTEALSVEGAASTPKIRANCVAPGAVDTQMLRTHVPEFKTDTQPEEIAQLIVYLCDEEASGALTGAVIEVNSNA